MEIWTEAAYPGSVGGLLKNSWRTAEEHAWSIQQKRLSAGIRLFPLSLSLFLCQTCTRTHTPRISSASLLSLNNGLNSAVIAPEQEDAGCDRKGVSERERVRESFSSVCLWCKNSDWTCEDWPLRSALPENMLMFALQDWHFCFQAYQDTIKW